MQNNRIWTKSFIGVFCTNLAVFIVFYGLTATLPLYASGMLNKPDQDAGLLVSIFLLSAIITRPLTGKILDMAGKRTMLAVSTAFYLLCTLLYYVIEPFGWLLMLRFFHGIWFSIATTASGAIAADIIPAARRGTGLGYFTMSPSLAMVLGPALSLTLIQMYSFDLLFIVLSIVMTAGALCTLSLSSASIQKTSGTKRKLSMHDLFEKRALPAAFLASLVGFAYASILSYLSIYAQAKGLLDMTSAFFLVFAAIMLLSRPFTGRLYDFKGPQYILYPGLLLFIIGLVLLAYTESAVSFLAAGGLIGLGYGSLLPSLQTVAIQAAPINRSGYATATFYTLFDGGIAVGSYVFGIAAGYYGHESIYLMSGALIFVVLLLTLYFKPKKQTEKADEAIEAENM